MNILYKTTLLITMAFVTWKVVKIEKNTRFKLRNFDYPKLITLKANHYWILLVTI